MRQGVFSYIFTLHKKSVPLVGLSRLELETSTMSM